MTPVTGSTAVEAIAADPDLREIRGGELTRITTTVLGDELPLILRAPATMPEDVEDPDEDPLNLSPDTVTEVLDLIAEDEDMTDIVTAGRDPESSAGHARRLALEELS
ncbi:hypothetical protein [Rhodococcus sp. NPDC127528]|uniref:hypothetical protein n=1 Tax=unclassified Rhodococcus (in: high G+C Gram-positive bacteria) TaxID=192944 RepID=UPI00362AA332